MMKTLTETTMKRLILGVVIGILLAPATARAQDEVVYYHTDAIGSVRMITDATGAVIHRYDALPFGESWDPPTNPDPRQFAGKEHDTETGLDYFGARYNASGSGRFTSVDPMLDIDSAMFSPQLWNRYAYALNNPFRYVDPSGAAVELLGGTEDRAKELELLRRSIGQLGSRLYINEVNDAGKTRYFVGITGDVGDFATAGGAAHNLANLVVHESVVEFGLTSQNLARWGALRPSSPVKREKSKHACACKSAANESVEFKAQSKHSSRCLSFRGWRRMAHKPIHGRDRRLA